MARLMRTVEYSIVSSAPVRCTGVGRTALAVEISSP
jgi:hypothetical protein